MLIYPQTTTLVQAPSTQVVTLTAAPSTYTDFRTQTISVPFTEVSSIWRQNVCTEEFELTNLPRSLRSLRRLTQLRNTLRSRTRPKSSTPRSDLHTPALSYLYSRAAQFMRLPSPCNKVQPSRHVPSPLAQYLSHNHHDHPDIAWRDLHKLPDRSRLQLLHCLHFLRHTPRTDIHNHSPWRTDDSNRVRDRDSPRSDLHRTWRQYHLHPIRHTNSTRLHSRQRRLPARQQHHDHQNRDYNMLRNGVDLQRLANWPRLVSA
jgi:hypothetical protein